MNICHCRNSIKTCVIQFKKFFIKDILKHSITSCPIYQFKDTHVFVLFSQKIQLYVYVTVQDLKYTIIRVSLMLSFRYVLKTFNQKTICQLSTVEIDVKEKKIQNFVIEKTHIFYKKKIRDMSST